MQSARYVRFWCLAFGLSFFDVRFVVVGLWWSVSGVCFVLTFFCWFWVLGFVYWILGVWFLFFGG